MNRPILNTDSHTPHRIITTLLIAVFICIAYSREPVRWQRSNTTNKENNKGKNTQPRKADMSLNPKTYTRPKPTKPVTPEMPGVNRRQPDKFFLEKADILYSNEEWDTTRQVVSGNVLFSKLGMLLYCDSAWYYPQSASMDAFGNVRMIQGDTIEVKADFIFYDGISQLARLRTAGKGNEVSLEHLSKRDNTKKYLFTDSLDYDLMRQLAYFNDGGRMYNHKLSTNERDTLTSRRGQYNTGTRIAEVSEDVYLHNRTSQLRTNRILYHTDSRTVDLVEPTEIYSGPDYIRTNSGTYNMASGNAELTSRSLITHKDSTGSVTTLEGDSIVYNNKDRRSEAYMFANPLMNPRPMIITDTARHTILEGGYGYYSDISKTAYAEQYPLLKEFSRPDTTFLRAEKIHLQTFNYGKKPIDPVILNEHSTKRDSLDKIAIDSINANTEYHIAKAYNRARFFRNDLQGIADSITFVSRDSMLYLDRKPIVWSDSRLIAGSSIAVHFNDSTADRADLPAKALLAENIGEGFFNQLRAGKMTAFLENETLKNLYADTDVQTILLPMENDSTYNKLVTAIGDSLYVDMDSAQIRKLKLYSRQGNDVSGQVIPIYKLQKSQYYLPEFVALTGAKRFSEMDKAIEIINALRPSYAWYRKGWEDSLGETSFELDEYFTNPDMGISPGAAITEISQ